MVDINTNNTAVPENLPFPAIVCILTRTMHAEVNSVTSFGCWRDPMGNTPVILKTLAPIINTVGIKQSYVVLLLKWYS